jgi:hypothetical protein
MFRLLRCLLPALLMAVLSMPASAAFDTSHAAWNTLLKQHVVLISNGNASQLDYAGMAKDKAALTAYLAQVSAVSSAEFESWDRDQRLAFLINAYNANTVALILSKYPKLASIKDLGSVFSSPWKKPVVKLFGKEVSLDDIEHGMIRVPGAYDDPRVHFAVNCASVGCPMLREEAYVAERLNEQLEQQANRFLSDHSRNRWDAASQSLEVSQIFEWYGGDFTQSKRGYASLADFFAQHAAALSDDSAAQAKIKTQTASIRFLEYDWKLNDKR